VAVVFAVSPLIAFLLVPIAVLPAVCTTATLPLKIVDFVDGPDSAVGDEFTDVLVMFNVGHQLLNTTGIG
jgi:hypothetical protein